MPKTVTLKGIYVSALRFQTVSNERKYQNFCYRKRHEDLVQFFKMESGLVACTDIGCLMQTLSINYNLLDWRPSIPVGHSVYN
jgi:hypothetical protein